MNKTLPLAAASAILAASAAHAAPAYHWIGDGPDTVRNRAPQATPDRAAQQRQSMNLRQQIEDLMAQTGLSDPWTGTPVLYHYHRRVGVSLGAVNRKAGGDSSTAMAARIEARWLFDNGIYLGGNFDYSDHDGSAWRAALDGGYGFTPSARVLILPHLGLLHSEQKNRGNTLSSTAVTSGVEVDYRFAARWTVSGDLTGRYFFKNDWKHGVAVRDAVGNWRSLTAHDHLGSGGGLGISTRLDYQVQPGWHLFGQIGYDRRHLDGNHVSGLAARVGIAHTF